MGKLSEEGTKFVGSISGWTATLLFMWMPVAQMVIYFMPRNKKFLFQLSVPVSSLTRLVVPLQWTNFLKPDNIKGLSAVSMLLAMIGNGLMIPRALFIRDFMWYA